jgi:hypothetical protein
MEAPTPLSGVVQCPACGRSGALNIEIRSTESKKPSVRSTGKPELRLRGYPLYIIPFIGVTHILGGMGLLIPYVPRLTEWVYAGCAFTLLLAFYSQLNSGGSTWDKFDPILVMAFVFASYVLRRCMRANRWSI